MSRYLEWKKRALMAAANHWWQPSGVSLEQCIAAFRFKGSDSKASAMIDVTEHGWNLVERGTDGVSWDAANGMYSTLNGYYKSTSLNSIVGGLSDGKAVNSLAYQNVKTAIVWYYTGWRATQFEDHTNSTVYALCAGFSHGLGYMGIQQGFVNDEYNQWGAQGYHFTNKPSIAMTPTDVKMLNNNPWGYHNGAVMGASWGYTGTNATTANANNLMYFNGVKMTGTETTHVDNGWEAASNKTWAKAGMIFDLCPFYTNNKPSDEPDRPDAVYAADCMKEGTWVKPRILAAAFFSVVLTDAQHQEVYRNMMTL